MATHGATADESLSALLDGECSADEIDHLLAELDGAPALKGRWSRMCLVREALQNTQVEAPAAGFSAGVMAAIRQDQAASRGGKVVPLPVVAANRGGVPRWRPLAGMAMAASLGALAVVGANRWLGRTAVPEAVPAGVAQAVPAPGASGLQPVTFPAQQPGRLVPVSAVGAEPLETRWSQLDAETASQLNEFMLEHSNLRAEQGMGGTLAYPRMAVHTAEYRAGEPR
ncbi:MAG: sigma-E factor negative regulatory protein [Nevskia sp.]|nr:sigma-E factor negative regulatory protein [Nevskia sp.]